MNCTELRDHYELYALGLAEEPGRDEIRQRRFGEEGPRETERRAVPTGCGNKSLRSS